MTVLNVGGCVEGVVVFFFQAEDGIRDLVRCRGRGDVDERQSPRDTSRQKPSRQVHEAVREGSFKGIEKVHSRASRRFIQGRIETGS